MGMPVQQYMYPGQFQQTRNKWLENAKCEMSGGVKMQTLLHKINSWENEKSRFLHSQNRTHHQKSDLLSRLDAVLSQGSLYISLMYQSKAYTNLIPVISSSHAKASHTPQ